jgi:hypothetical protein
MRRRTNGQETWSRLLEWSKGSAAAERLAGHILRAEGFRDVDPSHPLGGPDKLTDIFCQRDSTKWRVAAYFPRGQKDFGKVKTKFDTDLLSSGSEPTAGFIFVTNQELRKAERTKLTRGRLVELYHLERIASILDSPPLYGTRLEFLDIEMTKEEQVSFFAQAQKWSEELRDGSEELKAAIADLQTRLEVSISAAEAKVPLAELREFSHLLNVIVGRVGFQATILSMNPTIRDLRVPLDELHSFNILLQQIAGWNFSTLQATVRNLRVPLDELREFNSILQQIAGFSFTSSTLSQATVRSLYVPLSELKQFKDLLDRTVEKARELRDLSSPNSA